MSCFICRQERPETINIADKWLKDRGYDGVTIVSSEKTLGRRIALKEKPCRLSLMDLKPVHKGFKLQPQNKWANNYEPFKEIWNNGGKVTKFIGYDAGEERRADNAKKYNREDKKYDFRYPLIEWDIDREKCIEIIVSEGLEKPGKSSCFFCPNMRKLEIVFLKKKSPDLYERAIQIERNADLRTVKGLGRNYSWENLLLPRKAR